MKPTDQIAAEASDDVPPATTKHIQIRINESFPTYITLYRGSERKEYVLSPAHTSEPFRPTMNVDEGD